LASIAEFETELRKERQIEGIAKAKEKGVHFGRNSTLTDDQLQEMQQRRSTDVSVKDLAIDYGLITPSIYRLLSEQRSNP
jgi:DNA invertase Pin-like site-specific DNA recombinase